MTPLPARRLAAQQLSQHPHTDPRRLVAYLGAVQAQDLLASRWALGIRLGGDVDEAAVEHALSSGEVLRTHALRGTWQLVAPEDLRWIVALVGPRELTRAALRHRQLELEAATFRKSEARITKALADRTDLTRAELAEVLEDAGISTAGQRLAHLIQRLELDGLLCSGPMRGKQITFALVERRTPAGKPFDRPRALEELARRYFHSRGPATVADFTWWSGLVAKDARAGFEAVEKELTAETIAGKSYWHGNARAEPAPAALLLPAFDEYLIAYKDRAAVLDPAQVKRINAGGGLLAPTIVTQGRVVGTWTRTLGAATVNVDLQLFDKPSAAVRRALTTAANRYATFLGRKLTVSGS